MDTTIVRLARREAGALLALMLLAVAGCADTTKSSEAEAAEEYGAITVSYGPVAEEEEDLLQVIQDSETLEEAASAVEEVAQLPTDIEVDVRTCDDEEEGTYYDGETTVLICVNELLSDQEAVIADEVSEDVDQTMIDMADGYLLHELGHVVIGNLQLPIAGREEDAADQFVAWMALEWLDEPDVVLEAGNEYYFLNRQEDESGEEQPDADEHGTHGQRSANFLCWLYGSDPETYEYLIDDDPLTAARAEQCEYELEQLISSWDALMGVE